MALGLVLWLAHQPLTRLGAWVRFGSPLGLGGAIRLPLEILAAIVLFLVFPLTASLTLVALAAIIRPDRFEPMVAGWIYLGLLVVSICAAYRAFKALADDVHRRWPRKRAR
ncbi:MAG: hypothetical protein ACREDY_06450 [Bradyrhizobium sp.]